MFILNGKKMRPINFYFSELEFVKLSVHHSVGEEN